MLFDLRGRGRRRTIQVIYLGLAILMGGGLVLFGIGGNTSGGLLDAFKNGAGSQSSDFNQKRVTAARKKTIANPQDAAAWASLARAHFQNADYDQASNQFTQDGLKELSAAAVAWNHYLQLKPPKPDDQTANLMVQAFSDVGLKKPDKAVEAMEVVLAGRKPTAGLYGNYAILAYTAGQSRKGDLAVKKAVELAPKANKKSLKAQLDAAKSQALVQSAQSQQAPAVSGG